MKVEVVPSAGLTLPTNVCVTPAPTIKLLVVTPVNVWSANPSIVQTLNPFAHLPGSLAA